MSLTKISTIDRDAATFESGANAALDAWVDSIEGKAEGSHSHGNGGVVISLVANEAALGTGATDGEMKICADSNNRYTWDDGNSKWRVMPGNIYSSDPSSATYTIETGTIIFNTTSGALKRWNGSAFVDTSFHHTGELIRPKSVYTELLKFDAGTSEFVIGETVTGAGGATGVIVHIEVTSGTWGGNDAAGNMFINTRNAVAYVNDEALTGSATGAATANGVSTKNSIVIYPGSYQHEGTTSQTVYWTERVGFIFGSGGSNADSVNLDASNFFYVYIDDSAVVTAGTNILTASEFVANKTCADFVDAKVARYNGLDRMIFGVYSNAGSELDEFYHNGNTVMLADYVETQAAVDIDTTFTDVGALRIPGFAILGIVSFLSNAPYKWFWRTNGQTGTTGHRFGEEGNGDFGDAMIPVITDSSQVIEVKKDTAAAATIQMWTEGWKFPVGM